MSLTHNQRLLIEAVGNDNIHLARQLALACIKDDTTAKNNYWCDLWREVLDRKLSLVELPQNIRPFLCAEDVSGFNENRYYLTDREKALCDVIIKMNNAGLRLKELDISYLNATLLYGASGTGKTTFGKYMAKKMGLPFFI